MSDGRLPSPDVIYSLLKYMYEKGFVGPDDRELSANEFAEAVREIVFSDDEDTVKPGPVVLNGETLNDKNKKLIEELAIGLVKERKLLFNCRKKNRCLCFINERMKNAEDRECLERVYNDLTSSQQNNPGL